MLIALDVITVDWAILDLVWSPEARLKNIWK